MSKSDESASNLLPFPAPAAIASPDSPAAAAEPVRKKVLCPAGVLPASPWPSGPQPLLAYVIYSHSSPSDQAKP